MAALRRALLRTVTEDDIAAAVKALIRQAREGDVAAIRELLDRTVGKALPADAGSADDGEVTITIRPPRVLTPPAMARPLPADVAGVGDDVGLDDGLPGGFEADAERL